MKIAVIGTGYVGLVTGSCFAECGNTVVCVDNNEKKIRDLQGGAIPFYEPGLEELVKKNKEDGRLSFTDDLSKAVKDSSIVFIAVGTPSSETGAADLRAVRMVGTAIARALERHTTIVIKSTVPVGTSDELEHVIRRETTHSFDLLSNPEFLKQGSAVEDCMKPDRIVIGARSEQAAQVLKELYAPFVRTGSPVLTMEVRTAEMVKYAANVFLAARISFMNEIANLSERVGADVEMVRKGLSSDSRIGPAFLFPGVGYGGSCFPKDTKALIQMGSERGYEMRILSAVDAVNEAQPLHFVDKILNHFGKDVRGKRFGVWGLSFKPRTNDMRDAPSIKIIEKLLKEGAVISAYDPEAVEDARKIFGDRIVYATNAYGCVESADALVVVTEWQEFRRPDFERIRGLMRTPVIFDGRNVFDPAEPQKLGFTYFGIGRGR